MGFPKNEEQKIIDEEKALLAIAYEDGFKKGFWMAFLPLSIGVTLIIVLGFLGL